MEYKADQIDKLRDLVERQERAKTMTREQWNGIAPDPIVTERQVNTYLAYGTDLGQMEQHVRALEFQAEERTKKEKEDAARRETYLNFLGVLKTAKALAAGGNLSNTMYSYHYGPFDDKDEIRKKAVLEEYERAVDKALKWVEENIQTG